MNDRSELVDDFICDTGNVPTMDSSTDCDVPPPVPVVVPQKKALSDAKLNQLAVARAKASEARAKRAQAKRESEFDAMFEARFNSRISEYLDRRTEPVQPKVERVYDNPLRRSAF